MCSAGGGVLVEKTQWWRSRRSGGAVAEEMYAAAGAVKEGELGIGVLYLLTPSCLYRGFTGFLAPYRSVA